MAAEVEQCLRAQKSERLRLIQQTAAISFLLLATFYLSLSSSLPSFFTRWDSFFLLIALLVLTVYDFSLPAWDNLLQPLFYLMPLAGRPRFYCIPIEGTAPRPQLTSSRIPFNPRFDRARQAFLKEVDISQITVPRKNGGDGVGSIRVVVHRRKDGSAPAAALIVHFHGGGMVVGCAEDPISAMLASLSAEVVVCSVEYRKAPEHPFPEPFDDCISALVALHSDKMRTSLNVMENARIAVSGLSAGGGLAAAVALAAPSQGIKLAAQFLGVPMIAPPGRYPSYALYSRCNILPAATMLWFWRCYASRGFEDYQNMFCCPVDAPAAALKTLPPAFVWTGSCDALRDEGEMYVARMREQGVSVTHSRGFGSHVGCLLSKSFKNFSQEFCQYLLRAN